MPTLQSPAPGTFAPHAVCEPKFAFAAIGMAGNPRKSAAASPVLDGITACYQLVEFSN